MGGSRISRRVSITVERIGTSAREIPKHGGMRVPGRVFVSKDLIERASGDHARPSKWPTSRKRRWLLLGLLGILIGMAVRLVREHRESDGRTRRDPAWN
jgi:hypothetical protein